MAHTEVRSISSMSFWSSNVPSWIYNSSGYIQREGQSRKGINESIVQVPGFIYEETEVRIGKISVVPKVKAEESGSGC